MNGPGACFTLLAAALLLCLPRRWAPLPFLMGAALIPVGQEIAIGPLHFTVMRILITVGFARVVAKGERPAGGLNVLDRLVLLWGAWAVCSGVFHESGVLTTRLGMVYDAFGSYFLFRAFLQDTEDLLNVFRIVCGVLAIVAAAMMQERLTGVNVFSSLFGGTMEAVFRHGHFRARGPFVHAIAAGNVAAVSLPFALCLWRQERKLALLGLAATSAIVIASGSSGPVMTVLAILAALGLWRIRGSLRSVRWLALATIAALDVIMNDPVYFLIARIDITGGSTGWHRAALIQSAINHLSEWWLVGTDVTRHWMPTGIYASESQTDITNHYVAMGVWGGLLLLLLFSAILVTAWALLGKGMRANQPACLERQWLLWLLGATLFGHAVTFLSISYFDEASTIFLYLLLAAIGSIAGATVSATVLAEPESNEFGAAAEASLRHG